MTTALKKSRLPAGEAAICRRLREIRAREKLDQPEFAAQIGVSLDVLKSYEYGRAPVRYGVAKKFGEAFDINQRWLATGALPVHPYIDIAIEKEEAIPPGELFSLVYSSAIKDNVVETLKLIAETANCKIEEIDRLGAIPDIGPVGGPYDKTTLNIWRRVAHQMVSGCLYFTPPDLRQEFVDKLRKLVTDFARTHKGAIRTYSDHERRTKEAERERAEIAAAVRQQISRAKKRH